MAEPYIGEIIAFGGNFPPRNYMLCAGQLVSIAEYDALFNLIGTTYGGDGISTFGLPNLQGRVPLHTGQGPGLPNFPIGQTAGVESVTLTVQTMAAHNHMALVAQTASASVPNQSLYLANEGPPQAVNNAFAYGPPANTLKLAPNSVSNTGGNQPHGNRQPALAITYCIAMYGIYPQQG
jgi:microcystin-dependent protein